MRGEEEGRRERNLPPPPPYVCTCERVHAGEQGGDGEAPLLPHTRARTHGERGRCASRDEIFLMRERDGFE